MSSDQFVEITVSTKMDFATAIQDLFLLEEKLSAENVVLTNSTTDLSVPVTSATPETLLDFVSKTSL